MSVNFTGNTDAVSHCKSYH